MPTFGLRSPGGLCLRLGVPAPMRLAVLLVAVLGLAALVPLADTTGATESEEPLRIDRQATFADADTYMISIRTTEPSFDITRHSRIVVEAAYPVSNGSAPDEAAGMTGVVQYHSGVDCPPWRTGGFDPCFMTASGIPIKEAWDARVDAGPFTFEQDPDVWGFRSVTASIEWDANRTFEKPTGADQLTIRAFVSVPEAQALDVNVHIHSPDDISIHEETVTDTGFFSSGEDFDPSVGADTMAASAMVDGRETVDVDGASERLYAAFGPSWHGVSATGNVAVNHNTAAASNIAYEDPSGERTSGTALGLGSWSGILLPGTDQTGTHSFEVNAHAGAGPQDPYLIGWTRAKG